MNKNLIELGMEKSGVKIELTKSEEIQKNGISIGKFLFKSNIIQDRTDQWYFASIIRILFLFD